MLAYIKTNYEMMTGEGVRERKRADILGMIGALLLLCAMADCPGIKLPTEEAAGSQKISAGVLNLDGGQIEGESVGMRAEKRWKLSGNGARNRLARISFPSKLSGMGIVWESAAKEGAGEPQMLPVGGVEAVLGSAVIPAAPLMPWREPPKAEEIGKPMDAPNVSDALKAPDMSVSDVAPEAAEGVSGDMADDSRSGKDEAESGWVVFSINGFLCDAAGRIIGCDGARLTDGILCLPSDAMCTGIAAGAFASLGQEAAEVYIPANIVTIEEGAFDGLGDFLYIQVHPDNPAYASSEGFLIRK